MRRLVAGSLAALMLMFGVPVVGTANGSTASVLGQVVDAGGRASSGQTVELVLNGAVIGTTVTVGDGRFTFSNLVPGTYQVRTMVNNQPAGLQLSLKAGEAAQAVVVLPSMATSAAQAQFASLLANLATTVAGTTMATLVTELAAQAQEAADNNQVEDAIKNLTTLNTLLAALQTAGLSPAQTGAVAGAIIQIAVSLPPSTPIETQNALITFINNNPTIQIPGPTPGSTVPITTPRPIFTASGTL